MAKTTVKANKTVTKTSVKAAQAVKRAVIAATKFVKVAAKAIIAAAKAIIAAGGWVVVLIIVIVVIVELVVGSVFAIFTPTDDNGIKIYSVKTDLEKDYHQRQRELTVDQVYDVLNFEGYLASWTNVISVYAVKLNLDSDHPQEVATFDERKAGRLKDIFWDMHEVSVKSETHVNHVIHQEIDDDGNVIEFVEEISFVYLIVVTGSKSAEQMAIEYGFNEKQLEMLEALLREENAELWAGILRE